MMFASTSPSSQLVALLTRYLRGEIEERLWKRFQSMLERTEKEPQERLALIAFMNDFVVERNAQAANLFSEDRTLHRLAA